MSAITELFAKVGLQLDPEDVDKFRSELLKISELIRTTLEKAPQLKTLKDNLVKVNKIQSDVKKKAEQAELKKEQELKKEKDKKIKEQEKALNALAKKVDWFNKYNIKKEQEELKRSEKRLADEEKTINKMAIIEEKARQKRIDADTKEFNNRVSKRAIEEQKRQTIKEKTDAILILKEQQQEHKLQLLKEKQAQVEFKLKQKQELEDKKVEDAYQKMLREEEILKQKAIEKELLAEEKARQKAHLQRQKDIEFAFKQYDKEQAKKALEEQKMNELIKKKEIDNIKFYEGNQFRQLKALQRHNTERTKNLKQYQKEEEKGFSKAEKHIKDIRNLVSGRAGYSIIKQAIQPFYDIFQSFDTARTNLMSGKNINEAWYLLGINPTKDPRQVFDDILKKIRKIKDEGFRRTRAQELGFNADLMEALLRINPKSNVIQDLVKSFREFKIDLFEVSTRVALALAPAFEIVRNIIRNMVSLFGDIGGQLLKVYVFLKGLSLIKNNPLLAVGLLLEDLYVFAKNGDSAFERLLKKIGMSDNSINILRQSVNGLYDALKKVLELPFYPFKAIPKWIKAYKEGGKEALGHELWNLPYNKPETLDTMSIQKNNRNRLSNINFTNNQNFNIDGAKNVDTIIEEIKNNITGDRILSNFQQELNFTSWGMNHV